MKKTVVGIGEVLWDIFPDYKRPGGAPANVSYHASVLGNKAYIASSVGRDDNGNALNQFLQGRDLDLRYLQEHPDYPTGTVNVTFSSKDEAEYTIVENVAWDYITYTQKFKQLAPAADAVCFGTLAQRSEESRKTIRSFLEQTSPDCMRVLDINLREPYYNEEILNYSISAADVVKLNEKELETLQQMLTNGRDLVSWLFEQHDIRMVCLTKGIDGSELITRDAHFAEPRHKIDTSGGDSVGVGDAFTAALTHHILQGTDREQTLALANRYAAHIAAHKGGMPEVPLVIRESVG